MSTFRLPCKGRQNPQKLPHKRSIRRHIRKFSCQTGEASSSNHAPRGRTTSSSGEPRASKSDWPHPRHRGQPPCPATRLFSPVYRSPPAIAVKNITRPRFELGLRESKSLVLTVTLPGKKRAKVITWSEIARSMMLWKFYGPGNHFQRPRPNSGPYFCCMLRRTFARESCIMVQMSSRCWAPAVMAAACRSLTC